MWKIPARQVAQMKMLAPCCALLMAACKQPDLSWKIDIEGDGNVAVGQTFDIKASLNPLQGGKGQKMRWETGKFATLEWVKSLGNDEEHELEERATYRCTYRGSEELTVWVEPADITASFDVRCTDGGADDTDDTAIVDDTALPPDPIAIRSFASCTTDPLYIENTACVASGECVTAVTNEMGFKTEIVAMDLAGSCEVHPCSDDSEHCSVGQGDGVLVVGERGSPNLNFGVFNNSEPITWYDTGASSNLTRRVTATADYYVAVQDGHGHQLSWVFLDRAGVPAGTASSGVQSDWSYTAPLALHAVPGVADQYIVQRKDLNWDNGSERHYFVVGSADPVNGVTQYAEYEIVVWTEAEKGQADMTLVGQSVVALSVAKDSTSLEAATYDTAGVVQYGNSLPLTEAPETLHMATSGSGDAVVVMEIGGQVEICVLPEDLVSVGACETHEVGSDVRVRDCAGAGDYIQCVGTVDDVPSAMYLPVP